MKFGRWHMSQFSLLLQPIPIPEVLGLAEIWNRNSCCLVSHGFCGMLPTESSPSGLRHSPTCVGADWQLSHECLSKNCPPSTQERALPKVMPLSLGAATSNTWPILGKKEDNKRQTPLLPGDPCEGSSQLRAPYGVLCCNCITCTSPSVQPATTRDQHWAPNTAPFVQKTNQPLDGKLMTPEGAVIKSD